MKLRLLGLAIVAISLSMLGTSCMTMPSPGGRGGPSRSSGMPSPSSMPSPSGMPNPSRGMFPGR